MRVGELGGLDPVASNTMDAIVRGSMAGLELLLNICAMLIVLIALVHLVNAMLGLLPAIAGAPVTLERVLGVVMAPVCWLMGIPWSEAVTAGALMGLKTILNEFVAYLKLAALPADALSPRSRLIMLYALCGFANFGSLGIMIGGLATMAPERRDDVVSLGLQVDRVGHAVDLPDRRHRRRGDVSKINPSRRAWLGPRRPRLELARPSMQPEHPVDRAQFRRLDHLGMRDGNRMQVALQGLPPEIEEALKLREARTQVIGLPHIGLQQPGMIRTTVKNVGGRQAIARELLLEVFRYHSAPPPRHGKCVSPRP